MHPLRIPFASLIEQCRDALRRERSGLLYHLGLKPGPGAGGAGVTEQLRPHYRILATKGHVVWGSIAQVNMRMFLEGDEDLPGVTVYSLDTHYDAAPQDLRTIGHACFQFKNTRPADAQYRPLAERLTNEFDQTARMPLPSSLTEGREVFLGATQFHRTRLPGRVLRANLFPMVVAPERTELNMVLPLSCWPDDLRGIWRTLQQQLQATPSESTALEVAASAEKSPLDLMRRDWDIDEIPVWVTPAMAKYVSTYAKTIGIKRRPLLLVRVEDDGSRLADLTEDYDPSTEMMFRSNGVGVVVLKRQLERVRGAIVDYQSTAFGEGVLLRLLGE